MKKVQPYYRIVTEEEVKKAEYIPSIHRIISGFRNGELKYKKEFDKVFASANKLSAETDEILDLSSNTDSGIKLEGLNTPIENPQNIEKTNLTEDIVANDTCLAESETIFG